MKFDAKQNTYLISLISSAKEESGDKKNEQKRTSLDIIPVMSKKKKILEKARADEAKKIANSEIKEEKDAR